MKRAPCSSTPMDARNGNAIERPDRTTISEAALDVVEAGQQLVLDRIDLIREDALRTVDRLQHQVVLFAVAGVLLMIAWIALNCAGAIFLAQRFSWPIAGAIAGGINAIIGLVLMAWGSKRRTSENIKWR